jgi:hypothetical protein
MEKFSQCGQIRASVLECASPLALWHNYPPWSKRQETAAGQKLAEIRADYESVFICVYPWF